MTFNLIKGIFFKFLEDGKYLLFELYIKVHKCFVK